MLEQSFSLKDSGENPARNRMEMQEEQAAVRNCYVLTITHIPSNPLHCSDAAG